MYQLLKKLLHVLLSRKNDFRMTVKWAQFEGNTSLLDSFQPILTSGNEKDLGFSKTRRNSQ